MLLALIILAGSALVELLAFTAPLWRLRKTLATVLIVANSLATSFLLTQVMNLWFVLLAVFAAYRIINLARLVQDSMNPVYLHRVAWLTSVWLIGLQLVVTVLGRFTQPHVGTYIAVVAGLELLGAGFGFFTTLRQVKACQPPKLGGIADRDLPPLTVAIPARNETEDLEACLRSLAASSYPKFEVLVLDDCSQNKRTPEIIRAFAQAGVRFLAGKAPPGQWLAKNYAYEQLAAEANGSVILFCGVDVRFEPGSLRAIVSALLHEQAAMMSVMPRNQLSGGAGLQKLVVQPNRYAWEMVLPRRWLNRPPVLSTCWLVTKDALKSAGGFRAVTHSSSPESYFARHAARKEGGYSFIVSNDSIGLHCEKAFDAQRQTAVRTRYPQLHRRPELVALLTLAELSLLLLPFVLLVVSATYHQWPLFGAAAVTCGLLVAFYTKVMTLTYRSFTWRSLWLLPLAAVYDVALLNYSMWQYEFGEVIWKGRNVCIPVMRVTAGLE